MDRAVRMIRFGVVAAWDELLALLRTVGRAVAPVFQVIGRGLVVVMHGLGELARAFGAGLEVVAGTSWRAIR